MFVMNMVHSLFCEYLITNCHIYDNIKILFSLLIEIMSETILDVFENNSKPRSERQVTYFCRLCRNYGIKLRKAHLQNHHNANRDTVTKRSNGDLVNTIFVASK